MDTSTPSPSEIIEKKWSNEWNVSANYESDEVNYKRFETTSKPNGKPVSNESDQKPQKTGWAAKRTDGSKSRTETDIKLAKGYLNKMTAATFEKLSEQYLQIALKDPALLKKLIDQIFEQALSQPSFCPLYSNLCAKMFNHATIKVQFTKELLGKCQEEFQKEESLPQELTGDELLEYQFKAKRRMLSNIKFIGELYKNKILVVAIIHACIRRLFKMEFPHNSQGHTEQGQVDEEQVEALCHLFTNIGASIDTPKSKSIIDGYFVQIQDLKTKVPPRLRFLLEDLEDLRRNNWLVSRR